MIRSYDFFKTGDLNFKILMTGDLNVKTLMTFLKSQDLPVIFSKTRTEYSQSR